MMAMCKLIKRQQISQKKANRRRAQEIGGFQAYHTTSLDYRFTNEIVEHFIERYLPREIYKMSRREKRSLYYLNRL